MTSKVITLSTATAFAAALAFGAFVVGAGNAQATPAFAQQTKLGCPACHQGAPNKTNLTDTGKKFKANGNKM